MDRMSTLRKPRRLSYSEYLDLERDSDTKHELVAGYVYAMAGASEAHNRISGNIFFHLRAAARGGPCGVFMADMKIRIEEQDRAYYPDVSVVCDPADKDPYVKRSPCILVEVVSTSTESTDRREKLAAYLTIPSLRYYMLASSMDRQVECFARDDSGDWVSRNLEEGESLIVRCSDVSAELDLELIYEDVLIPEIGGEE
jgi:Uma2 family endonuclease